MALTVREPEQLPLPLKQTILIFSQVYVPDPAAVGQYMHEAAAELVRRGWRVRVLTSDRGYDDPSVRFPRREVRDGVEIHRLPWCSFGKKSIPVRLLGQLSFLIQCIFRGLFMRDLAGLFITTSPPMAAIAALSIAMFRRTPIAYWVMDLNPDQVVVLGKLSERSPAVRAFNVLNRMILKRANEVIVLDRFMAERVLRKRDIREKLHIMPPWPHQSHLEVIEHADNPFRREHGLENKLVVMYSGNHTSSNPLSTVLQAALRLQHREELIFMFIGGGMGKKEVEQVIAQHKPRNIISLPYQPLDRIKYSLSAADVHLVSVGETVVGVVHPCKVYGAMAVQRPILLLGPDPCHVSDIIDEHRIGWRIRHGDVDGAVATLEAILATPESERRAMGARAARLTQEQFSDAELKRRLCDVVEQAMRNSPRHATQSETYRSAGVGQP